MGSSSVVKSEVEYLRSYMNDWYLWYSQMPSADLTQAATVDQALDALRAPQDRYSFIESAAVFSAFFDEGRTVGFGVGLTVQGDSLFVRVVQPNSQAAAQGVLRGDRIVSINGELVSTLIAEQRLDAAIGPAVVGLSADLTVQRAGSTINRTLTKTEYSLKYILSATVFMNGHRKTGYVYFTSFGTPGRDEWRAALTSMINQGVTDLVVDLRDNGGGFLSIANDMASSLAPAQVGGQLAFQLLFNNRHSSSNQQFVLSNDPLAGNIERLAWITSARTCSASEALMAALMPYRAAARVGSTTCGKPVGFTPPEFNGKVYNVVSFTSSNRDGFSDYYSGLAADCAVSTDDLSHELGDPAELNLQTALQRLATGNCPAVATKSTGAVYTPLGRGMTRMSGLH